MMLTAAQVRGARTLLGWMSFTLADRAKVGLDKALKAQDEARVVTLSDAELSAIRTAFEDAGVLFTADSHEVCIREFGP